MLEVVEAVFAHYRDSAQSQLLAMQRNLNVRVDSIRPQSRVRLGARGLEITLRYPVDARNEVQVADEISRRLLDLLAHEPRCASFRPRRQIFSSSPWYADGKEADKLEAGGGEVQACFA